MGVESAIRMAQEKHCPILGPLVHNPKVVADLAEEGIPILERYADLDALPGISELIITAHGYPKHLKEDLEARGIVLHDATCPVLSKRVYGLIERIESEGSDIILIGNPDHAEIIATRSYGERIHVVYSEEDVQDLPPDLKDPVAICQTTITGKRLNALVEQIRRTCYPNLKLIDTRCGPVRLQQEGVDELAQRVNAMLIVGGHNSSNTTNLARIARVRLPKRTYHIESPDELQPEWLDGVRRLGIGAGTSTPWVEIDRVKERIRMIFPGEVVEVSC
jgi:4-hydroxy-3-methylbut-2-enyl diphosphate reductase